MFFLAAASVVLEAALLAIAFRLFPDSRDGTNRPQGPRARELYLYEVAFLAGGAQRVVDVVLLRLQQSGRAHISSTGTVTVPASSTPADDVEMAVMRTVLAAPVPGTATVPQVRFRTMGAPEVQRVYLELVADGYLVEPRSPARLGMRAFAFAALGVGFLPGMALIQGFPGFLGVPLYLAGLIVPLALLKQGGLKRITPAGEEQLRVLNASNPWARSPETAMAGAVALQGRSAIDPRSLRVAMRGPGTATPTSSFRQLLAGSGRGGRSGGSSGGGCGCGSGCGSGGGGCGSGGGGCGGGSSSGGGCGGGGGGG